MTKSQNTKKDLCITSEQLTEQWKKNELPEGHYYIKTHNETTIDEYIQWYKDHGIPSEKSFAYFNIQQVLAPVPTFDEWQAKLEENAQLKELLRIILSKTEICYSMVFQKDIISAELNEALLKKIDEALQ